LFINPTSLHSFINDKVSGQHPMPAPPQKPQRGAVQAAVNAKQLARAGPTTPDMQAEGETAVRWQTTR
jgi:hypothetical protein